MNTSAELRVFVQDLTDERVVSGDEILNLLAGLARWPEEADAARVLLDRIDAHAWADAAELAGIALPAEEPAWLEASERLALAQEAARQHDGTPEALLFALSEGLEPVPDRCAAVQDAWRYGARAESIAGVLPWSALATDVPAVDGEQATRVDAWIDGLLGPDSRAQLASTWNTEPVSSALRAALRVRLGPVHWTSWPSALHMVGDDRPLLRRVGLPHHDPPVELQLRLHPRGVLWRVGDAEPRLVGSGTETLEDPLGAFDVELLASPAAEEDFPARAALVARALRVQREVGAQALSLAASLGAGWARARLQAGADAFEAGDDISDGLEGDVAWLLSVRADLDELAAITGSAALITALLEADEALRGTGSAVLLLPAERYADIVGDRRVDPEAWWGEVERLDRFASVNDVAGWARAALGSQLTAGGPGPEVISLLDRIARPASTWPLAAAGPLLDTDGAEDVGAIPLLLWDAEEHRPLAGVLRVSAVDGAGLWGDQDAVGGLAWGATRLAFAALADLMPAGAPRALEDHRVEILPVDLAKRGVDGRSMGLPVALALASCWTGRPVPEGLFASAAVAADGQLRRVGRIKEKASAAIALRGAPGTMLLVAPRDADQAAIAQGVDELKAALERAGLSLEAVCVRRTSVSGKRRLRELKALIEEARSQDLTRHRGVGGANPWSVLAQRLETVAASLPKDERSREICSEGWIRAAICHSHTGDLAAVERALAQAQDAELPPLARLLGEIVAAGAEIDRATQDAEHGWQGCLDRVSVLESALAAVPASDRLQIEGTASSQIGRLLLHAGRPALAGPRFERAIDCFARSEPHELPRGRIYLAMTLRRVGDLDAATEQLKRADVELGEDVWDPTYAAHTRMYWRYERGRLAVARGDGVGALDPLLRGLREAREHGFWPRLGILRTLVWACRIAGLAAEEAIFLEELQALSGPPAYIAIFAAEAEGRIRRDGEVY